MTTEIENEPKPLIEKFGDSELYTGSMAVMRRDAGDNKYLWDKNDATSVKLAKKHFEDCRKEGMLAYKVIGKDGTKGEQINEFDPTAERIIFTPALAGG